MVCPTCRIAAGSGSSLVMRLLASLLLLAAPLLAQAKPPLRFEVSWANPMDGRVVLVISTTGTPEPRFSISEGLNTQQMFGADANYGGFAEPLQRGEPTSASSSAGQRCLQSASRGWCHARRTCAPHG